MTILYFIMAAQGIALTTTNFFHHRRFRKFEAAIDSVESYQSYLDRKIDRVETKSIRYIKTVLKIELRGLKKNDFSDIPYAKFRSTEEAIAFYEDALKAGCFTRSALYNWRRGATLRKEVPNV